MQKPGGTNKVRVSIQPVKIADTKWRLGCTGPENEPASLTLAWGNVQCAHDLRDNTWHFQIIVGSQPAKIKMQVCSTQHAMSDVVGCSVFEDIWCLLLALADGMSHFLEFSPIFPSGLVQASSKFHHILLNFGFGPGEVEAMAEPGTPVLTRTSYGRECRSIPWNPGWSCHLHSAWRATSFHPPSIIEIRPIQSQNPWKQFASIATKYWPQLFQASNVSG